MEKKRTRLSVDLSPESVKCLRLQAAADGRLLKPYVEKVLTKLATKKSKK